jgi:hypothetical protein
VCRGAREIQTKSGRESRRRRLAIAQENSQQKFETSTHLAHETLTENESARCSEAGVIDEANQWRLGCGPAFPDRNVKRLVVTCPA